MQFKKNYNFPVYSETIKINLINWNGCLTIYRDIDKSQRRDYDTKRNNPRLDKQSKRKIELRMNKFTLRLNHWGISPEVGWPSNFNLTICSKADCNGELHKSNTTGATNFGHRHVNMGRDFIKHNLTSKLDRNTHKKWLDQVKLRQGVPLQELIEFLEIEASENLPLQQKNSAPDYNRMSWLNVQHFENCQRKLKNQRWMSLNNSHVTEDVTCKKDSAKNVKNSWECLKLLWENHKWSMRKSIQYLEWFRFQQLKISFSITTV